MTRSSKLSLTAAVALALSLTLPGTGVSQDPSDDPVMYTGIVFSYTPNGFALEGEAEILQGDNRLRAERIEAFTNDNSDLSRVEASGEVFFVTPTQTLRGDRAVLVPLDNREGDADLARALTLALTYHRWK